MYYGHTTLNMPDLLWINVWMNCFSGLYQAIKINSRIFSHFLHSSVLYHSFPRSQHWRFHLLGLSVVGPINFIFFPKPFLSLKIACHSAPLLHSVRSQKHYISGTGDSGILLNSWSGKERVPPRLQSASRHWHISAPGKPESMLCLPDKPCLSALPQVSPAVSEKWHDASGAMGHRTA